MKVFHDFLGNLTLQGKNILQFPVITARPEASSGFSLDQLYIDLDLVFPTPDTSLHQIGNIQLICDLFQTALIIGKRHDRGAGHDP